MKGAVIPLRECSVCGGSAICVDRSVLGRLCPRCDWLTAAGIRDATTRLWRFHAWLVGIGWPEGTDERTGPRNPLRRAVGWVGGKIQDFIVWRMHRRCPYPPRDDRTPE